MLNKLNNRQAKFDKAATRGLKQLFRRVLTRLGVGGLSASIATHFVFKYIFKPMAHHFLKKDVLKSFTYFDGPYHYVVHKKGVEVVKRAKKRRVSF